MKKLYGEDYIARLTEKATRKYLQGRNSDSIGETSLHKMLGQHYLRYEKGPVIYNALRLLIGEDKLNQSLRNLLKEKAFATTDYATSYDLIKHIQLVAGNSFDPLIKEWLMQVSVYDLSIEDTKMVKNASGKYQVTATLLGKKLPFEQNKDDKEIAFQHHVPVAIYSKKSGKHYILKQFDVQLIKGKKQLSILLDEEPSKIVIDPNFMFIDRNQTDNTVFTSKSS
jgi:aminopeptidase N